MTDKLHVLKYFMINNIKKGHESDLPNFKVIWRDEMFLHNFEKSYFFVPSIPKYTNQSYQINKAVDPCTNII